MEERDRTLLMIGPNAFGHTLQYNWNSFFPLLQVWEANRSVMGLMLECSRISLASDAERPLNLLIRHEAIASLRAKDR